MRALKEPKPDFDADDESRETLAVFRAISESQTLYGPNAIGPFIVSMTQGADDVLSVLVLAHWAGLADGGRGISLDVAPLLETVDDLKNGPAIMGSLLSDSTYRKHLQQRGLRQIIMIGYSDSNKDGGLAASRWALRDGEKALVKVMRAADVSLTLFHGRGGTISRVAARCIEQCWPRPRDRSTAVCGLPNKAKLSMQNLAYVVLHCGYWNAGCRGAAVDRKAAEVEVR